MERMMNSFAVGSIRCGAALSVLILLGSAAFSVKADVFNLTEPVTVAQPEAVAVDIRGQIFEPRIPRIRVIYRALDVNDTPIPELDGAATDRTFICDGADSTQCTGVETPWTCCTGLGTGVCEDADMCYSDIADYVLEFAPTGWTFAYGFNIFIRNQMCEQIPLLTGKCGTFR
jgi:hypothetical protein